MGAGLDQTSGKQPRGQRVRDTGAIGEQCHDQENAENRQTFYAIGMLSGESLLGIPIQAFADTVIGFLVFGVALMMTGAGKFFINIAFALCGTFRGGAAKVCIFASGLLGMSEKPWRPT